MRTLLFVFFTLFCITHKVNAQDSSQETVQESIEVGKHVAANIDAMSMIVSLLMVLAVIFLAALVLKRFQGGQPHVNGLKIISSLHLGSKEKLVVVQAGNKQLVLGVTSQQINLIDVLDEPLPSPQELTPDITKALSKIFKNKTVKAYDKQE